MSHPNFVGVSSGILNASGFIKNSPGKLHSITIMAGTGALNDVRLWDGGLSGIMIFQAKRAAVVSAGDITDHYTFERAAFSSLYLAITSGTDISVIVVYE